jgi:hypothetical protein
MRKTMTQTTIEGSDKIVAQRSPGYLMAPFGWATKPLAALLEADHSLYLALFTISRRRMERQIKEAEEERKLRFPA